MLIRWISLFSAILLIIALWIFLPVTKQQSKGFNDNSSASISIIPQPKTIQTKQGSFTLNRNVAVEYSIEDSILFTSVKRFIKVIEDRLKPITDTNTFKSTVIFKIDSSIIKEGYKLNVQQQSITISASSKSGFDYALISLFQLISPIDFNGFQAQWEVPCVSIIDEPQFSYRGLHLDVARHFMHLSFIKKMIIQLEKHKMNTLHLHLTDDQGWRMEIKKFPKLTSVGAKRNQTLIGHSYSYPHQFKKEEHKGFYSQKELKELVAFALKHNVTIIPEIEMPGHASAAIASYPYLGVVRSDSIEVPGYWGVFPNLFNYSDTTFAFIEDVLKEVMEVFPSKIIHIGGDEALKIQWDTSRVVQEKIKNMGLLNSQDLQAAFVQRIEKFLKKHNREMIGWDELMEEKATKNAKIMSWRGETGGIEAAKAGREVVMSPMNDLYFDLYQGNPATEPLAIGGYLPLKKVYNYNPIPDELNQKEAKFIIGAQANVWTEYMPNENQVEYMVFPRIAALSEVLWGSKKDYSYFLNKLRTQLLRYEFDFINYSKAFTAPIFKTKWDDKNQRLNVVLSSDLKEKSIKYHWQGNALTYQNSIEIDKKGVLKAYLTGHKLNYTDTLIQEFHPHKGIGNMDTIIYPYRKIFPNMENTLYDGIRGTSQDIYTARWARFIGNPLEVIYHFKNPNQLKSIAFQTVENPIYGFVHPENVIVMASNNLEDFKEIAINYEFIKEDSNSNMRENIIYFESSNAYSYYKITATIPAELVNTKGQVIPATLLVDELILN